jgi:hypothetical protein
MFAEVVKYKPVTLAGRRFYFSPIQMMDHMEWINWLGALGDEPAGFVKEKV